MEKKRLDKTILIDRNIGRLHSAINCNKSFFDPPPSVMEIKTKVNKLDLIKLKSFSQQRKPLKKSKKPPLKLE